MTGRDSTGTRIVLIDDDAQVLQTLGRHLIRLGYTVGTASDVAAGLTVCREWEPHLLITELRMPDFDGVELLESVPARRSYRVIAMTGGSPVLSGALLAEARRAGASAALSKPLDPEVVTRVVKAVLAAADFLARRA